MSCLISASFGPSSVRANAEHFYQPNQKRGGSYCDPIDAVVAQILASAIRVVSAEKIYLARGVQHEEKSPQND